MRRKRKRRRSELCLSSLRTQGPIIPDVDCVEDVRRLRLTDGPRGMGPCVRRDDVEGFSFQTIDTRSRSRDVIRPRLAINFLALRSEGAGNAGRPMRPIAARAMVVGRTHTRCQVTPESPGTPRAVVYAYTCTPRRSAFLPPSPAGLTAGLTPAPRCQDNTISPSASGTLVRSALRVHRIPAPRW